MKTIFGVSSEIPSNSLLKNGYTMYDWVMRQECFPEFWGRYISGKNAVTKNELEFLKEKDCRVALLFDEFTEAEIASSNAFRLGNRVVEIAKTLGVPRGEGIVIYADINPEWSINHDWMVSFSGVLVSAGYVAGFIGNTDSSKNFSFDRESSHYLQSIKYKKYLKASFGATEPKCSVETERWVPYCPSGMNTEDIELWRCNSISFDQFTVESVLARDENVLEKFWDLNRKEIK